MNQGLWLLTNQLYRSLPPSLAPALGFGFAVDGGSGSAKNFFPFLRSIPKKCHCGQAGAVSEGRILDAGDAITNGDARQVLAATEGPLPDVDDAIRNRNTRQSVTAIKGTTPDAGDTIGDRDAGQAATFIEGETPDAGNASANRDTR